MIHYNKNASWCASRRGIVIRENRIKVERDWIWTQVVLVLSLIPFWINLQRHMLRWWTVVKWWHKAGPSQTRQPLVSKHLLGLPVYEYPGSEKLHWVHGWVTSHTLWTACVLFKRIRWYLFESGLLQQQHSTPFWLYVRRESHTEGVLSNGSYKKVTKPQD